MSIIAQLARRVVAATSGTLGMEQVIQASANESCQLFASASRTATVATEEQHNLRARGVIATINITSAGSGSVKLVVQRWDPVSDWVTLADTANLTTDGATSLTVYPGLTGSANVVVSAVIPRKWRVQVTHNNANAITYSVGISTLS